MNKSTSTACKSVDLGLTPGVASKITDRYPGSCEDEVNTSRVPRQAGIHFPVSKSFQSPLDYETPLDSPGGEIGRRKGLK